MIAPSQWAAAMIRRYFPVPAVTVIAHGSGTGMAREDAVYTRLDLPADGIPTVAVIGAIGSDKGSRRLERLVELTRQRGAALRWVLIGYLDSCREQMQSEDAVFTLHGPYDSREIGALLEHYRVRLVAYPSAGPETFSFTLSEAWAAGRPALVPPIGALAERVAASGGGWVLDEDEWQDEARLLDRIVTLLAAENAAAWSAAAARATGGAAASALGDGAGVDGRLARGIGVRAGARARPTHGGRALSSRAALRTMEPPRAIERIGPRTRQAERRTAGRGARCACAAPHASREAAPSPCTAGRWSMR